MEFFYLEKKSESSNQIINKLQKDSQNQHSEKYDTNEYLCCAVCQNRITRNLFSMIKNGTHIHYRENPQQQRFAFRCFSEAEGCRVTGSPSHEYSWFSGYSWQIAQCRKCGTQSGWYFNSDDSFFALIEEQLVKCDSSN